jgi:DNA polymerase III alpha subunit
MTPDQLHAEDGTVLTVTGALSEVLNRISKQGRAWATATLTDGDRQVEAVFFPHAYDHMVDQLIEGAEITLTCRMDHDGDGVARLLVDTAPYSGGEVR